LNGSPTKNNGFNQSNPSGWASWGTSENKLNQKFKNKKVFIIIMFWIKNNFTNSSESHPV
jgi:hypothetical protein